MNSGKTLLTLSHAGGWHHSGSAQEITWQDRKPGSGEEKDLFFITNPTGTRESPSNGSTSNDSTSSQTGPTSYRSYHFLMWPHWTLSVRHTKHWKTCYIQTTAFHGWSPGPGLSHAHSATIPIPVFPIFLIV